jgi:hypothetical protein
MAWMYPAMVPKIVKNEGQAGREERALRSTHCAMKAMWFTSATIFGYYVMHDLPWFPSVLGGTAGGDAGKMFAGYP